MTIFTRISLVFGSLHRDGHANRLPPCTNNDRYEWWQDGMEAYIAVWVGLDGTGHTSSTKAQ